MSNSTAKGICTWGIHPREIWPGWSPQVKTSNANSLEGTFQFFRWTISSEMANSPSMNLLTTYGRSNLITCLLSAPLKVRIFYYNHTRWPFLILYISRSITPLIGKLDRHKIFRLMIVKTHFRMYAMLLSRVEKNIIFSKNISDVGMRSKSHSILPIFPFGKYW